MGLEKINDMRKHIGMSLDDLSEKSGVPKGTLSKITAGITKNPSIDTVKSIVHSMGFTLDDLDNFPHIKEGGANLSVEDLQLLKRYNRLDSFGKELTNMVIEKELERSKAQKQEKVPDQVGSLVANEDSEYIELVARGGKYKVKRADFVKWLEQVNLDDYKIDRSLG